MKTDSNPFRDAAPAEVPLQDSPLVRVIAQVQFPAQLGLVERPTISEIQKVIGEMFPALEEQKLKTYLYELGEQEGRLQPQVSPDPQWRFSHPDTGFALQINSTSITLETTQYTSRTDFFERFKVCLQEIHKRTPLSFVSRLGVRYIDQVPDSRCKDIHTMICEPFRGISGLPIEIQAMADMHDFLVPIEKENGLLHCRTGFVPPNASIDPAVAPPIGERSWILDLDLFRQGSTFPFNPEILAGDASAFALRIYTVFRWLINEEFLKRFGGQP